MRAKVWRGLRGEPRKWQSQCVDDSPSRLMQGAPGVWSAGPGAKHWDDLRVIPLDSGVFERAGTGPCEAGQGAREGRPEKPVP